MNKSSGNSLNNVNFSEDWSSHPAIEWLSSNRKILLWGFLIFLACLILTYRVVAMRTLNAENDFFHAQTAFNQFQQAILSAQNSSASTDLEQLETIMTRHPEIKPRYEGSLAQALLLNEQIPQAQVLADDIFKRTQSEHLQVYQDYSRTSLLIGEGRYSEALQQTQQLKSALDQLNENAQPLLYVFNLIRLAMLYQQIGQLQEELQTWEQLQNQTQRFEAMIAANQVFKMGEASLNQYIEERKKVLYSTLVLAH